jgi:hypothetical protein
MFAIKGILSLNIRTLRMNVLSASTQQKQAIAKLFSRSIRNGSLDPGEALTCLGIICILIALYCLAAWLFQRLKGPAEKKPDAETPEEPESGSEVLIFFVIGLLFCTLGASCESTPSPPKRPASNILNERNTSFNPRDYVNSDQPLAYQLPKLSVTGPTAMWRDRLELPKLAAEIRTTAPWAPRILWPVRPRNFIEKSPTWWARKVMVDFTDLNIEGAVTPGGAKDGKANGK